mgnify:CR=1 FL=1
MSKTIFELGSINQDLSIEVDPFPKSGETANGKNLQITLGGKGANQAIALLKAGASVSFFGKVGKDEFGDGAYKILSSFGLNMSHVRMDEKEKTGIAIILLNQGNNRIVLSHGANYAIKKEEIDEFLSYSRPGDYFLSQYENEPAVTQYAFRKAKEKGLMAVWNPSPMGDYPKDLLSYIDLLVVNEIEAAQILEKEGKSNLGELGIKSILLTLGDKGCRYIDRSEDISFPALKITPIDTTGAGDTFLGFFLGTLSKGESIPNCLKIATKASAYACLKRGASQSIPSLSDLH